MINIEAQGSTIYLFGRHPDGTPYNKAVAHFKPYFYVADPAGEHTSIFGDKARKVFVNHPADVRRERDKYPLTFEADVTYVNRYMLDTTPEIAKEPLRIWYLDIECLHEGEGFPSAKEAKKMITVIGWYDSMAKEYRQLTPTVGKLDTDGRTHVTGVFSEEEMLRIFVREMHEKRPDIILAWNGSEFDYPYILNRMRRLGIDMKMMSPMLEVQVDENKIRGITLFDSLKGYKKLVLEGRESYKLDFIGSYELDMPKLDYGDTDDLWKNDLPKLLEYNRRDIEIMVALDKKFGMMEFYDEVRRMSHSTFDDILMNSRIIDFYILDYCKKHSLILPTRNKDDEEVDPFEGALVLEPIKGLHENVVVGDLKSLYPSIIVSANMSPETIIPAGTQITEELKEQSFLLGNNTGFFREPKGIFPIILDELFSMRQEAKRMFKETKDPKYDQKQKATKILMNSFYGVLGHPGFRLYRREIADSVTWFGRQVITWTKDRLHAKGYTVIAGDTDSVFFSKFDSRAKFKGSFQFDEDYVVDGKRTIENINATYQELTRQYGIENHILELQFEKIYKTVFFMGKKKRYAGLTSEGALDIKGFESRRSDTPYIARKLQKEVLRMILEKKPKSDVITHIKSFISDVTTSKFSVEEIALPIGITKPIEEYKTLPIHIRAAKLANERHRANIKSGDKVKYVYVKNNKENVIAFTEKMWTGYEVDTERMLERIVYMKLDGIFEGMGWNISELKGQTTLGEWF